MKNDCIILKKKEYEELVAKANWNKPDYINVIITVKTMGSIPKNFDLLLLDTSLNLSAGIQNQILSIKGNIEERFDKLLETWVERENKKTLLKIKANINETKRHIRNLIMTDLEDLIHKWPLRNALKEWKKIIQDEKYFEL